MTTFRYHLNGTWFKGNTHLHSTISDGKKTWQELGHLYRQSGYDFLCLTDHWIPSHLNPGQADDGLLWLNGLELNGQDARGQEYHIVCLGDFEGIDDTHSLEEAVQSAVDQGGFIILAHPFWTGNNLEDTQRFPFHACEIFNHVCQCEIGKGNGLIHYNYMLERNPRLLGIACDDTHFLPDLPVWKGGWVMVNAVERSHTAIQAALRDGNYYSSTGPEFYTISCQGRLVQVETSPVQFIKLVGPAWHGHGRAKGMVEEAQPVTSAEFEIPENWAYAYIEIEDTHKRCAWTNNLFIP